MNWRPLHTWRISLLILAISNLIPTSCAPSVVAEGQLRPTQSFTATPPPYPGPATTATSPAAAPTKRGIWGPATPLPNEQFTVGEITPSTKPSEPRYSFREERRDTEAGYPLIALFVRDDILRTETRIGDDNGSASFEVMSDEYIIWRRGCGPCEFPALPSGLYAYVLATGEQIFIGKGGTTEISGSWVAYLTAAESANDHTGLRAHNLLTGEDIPLARALPYFRGRLIRDVFAIHENRVAWVDLEPTTQAISIGVYDLDTHTSQKLNIPTLTEPHFVGVSNEVVIWQDGFWKGYLLKENALFTIPFIPPGWENMTHYVSQPITMKGNRLHWAFNVDDDFYYFTAPIVPKGQGAQPTHIVPTPHRKPTAPPVAPTPTPVALPTAYP